MFIKQQRMTPEQQERYQLLKQKWLSKLSNEELCIKSTKNRSRNLFTWSEYDIEVFKRKAQDNLKISRFYLHNGLKVDRMSASTKHIEDKVMTTTEQQIKEHREYIKELLTLSDGALIKATGIKPGVRVFMQAYVYGAEILHDGDLVPIPNFDDLPTYYSIKPKTLKLGDFEVPMPVIHDSFSYIGFYFKTLDDSQAFRNGVLSYIKDQIEKQRQLNK